MTVPRASIVQTEQGTVPQGEGWYVLNAAEARWNAREPEGQWLDFEPDGASFPGMGMTLAVLQPGEPACLYHAEPVFEGCLILDGEAVAIVEEDEVPLRRWDFMHWAAGTNHVVVGAGDGPCTLLIFGVRSETVHYPASATAARHGASAKQPTDQPSEAYAGWRGELRHVPSPLRGS